MEAGALFFCVPGRARRRARLRREAVAHGAAALVVERPLELDVPQLVVEDARVAMAVAADVFFGEPTRRARGRRRHGDERQDDDGVPALRSILEAAGRRPGLVGTVEWIVGGERRPAPHTTPEAIDLQRLFREMLDARRRSRGDRGVLARLARCGRLDRVRFDALVFTNLTQDHLDLHGTMEEYFQAKRRLFTGAEPPPAAVNVGDEYGRRLADELAAPSARRSSRSASPTRPRCGRRVSSSARAAAASRAAGIEIETPLRGRFNVENVLGAVAAGAPARHRRRGDRRGRAAR